MLKEQSRLLQRGLFLTDLLLVVVGWLIAYWIRFEVLTPPQYRPLEEYIRFLPPILVLWGVVFLLSGIYGTARAQRLPALIFSLLRAIGIGMLVVMASLFFWRTFSFSRLHMTLFGLISSGLLIGFRVVLYTSARQARRRGKNLRHVLIVGAGDTGRKLAHAFRQYPWMGIRLLGFADDDATGPDVVTTVEDVPAFVDRAEAGGTPVDYVYIALPLRAADRIETLLGELSTRLAHVYFVPDLFQFDLLHARLSDIDGMPVLHLIDEPALDVRRLVKRGMDVVLSAAVLLALSPLYLLLALLVKLSSPGPVFYRQERMGLNGHTFDMLKFRSMPVTAEAATGPVWASRGENRATPVGAFLRKTSLDELPQFINVLKGDMSIVGPRPERPHFIRQFREQVPRYMLRHKMKAGITGWAQVNGWRGNTSLDKRIEFDLWYIQHWSLWLDLKIMMMTPFTGLVHKNAY